MREHLYHGKRVDNGEWVEGFYLNRGEDIANYIIFIDNNGILCGREVLPETVGEYTGLTDKNGKKIFEGDIVKVEYFSDWGENFVVGIGVIVWNLSSVSFVIKIEGNVLLNLFSSRHTGIEIIGNIYDNPELLSGENG